ncbi:hypothetical protein, partial [Mycobacterium tuberculosis]|uniref:hypothetical protein n=1 Tax=Mycobacterium tuberculosis TaxID=1773 RepID=UPI00158767AA
EKAVSAIPKVETIPWEDIDVIDVKELQVNKDPENKSVPVPEVYEIHDGQVSIKETVIQTENREKQEDNGADNRHQSMLRGWLKSHYWATLTIH